MRYNNCKYLCIQHSSLSIHKAKANSHKKREIDSNTIIVGDFNAPLSPTDRSYKMKIRKHKLLKGTLGGFPGGSVVNNPPANAENMGSSPGTGRSHMLWSN